MAAISDAEKAEIASDFIRHAPPGEFNEVFSDVRTIVNNDVLIKQQCYPSIVGHDNDQLLQVRLDEDSPAAVVSEYGAQGNGKYLDPDNHRVLTFDHLSKKCTSEEKAPPADENVEQYRSSLSAQLKNYFLEHYPNHAYSVYGSLEGSLIKLVVCLQDSELKSRNCWNGRWRSVWKANVSTNDSTAELNGTIKVQVHYYEEGNVQMMSNKSFSHTVKFSGVEDFAKKTAEQIKDSENKYQVALSENYALLSSSTFKALRKILPVTHQEIDWDKIQTYKIGSAIQNAAS